MHLICLLYTQMSHCVCSCLLLSVASVPFLDNALHIQRRQPVGTWRYNTLPSCTGLLISLLVLFFPFFVWKHCIAIFHHHPSLWLPLALYFGACMSSACWGFSVPPCSFVWFATFSPLFCFHALEPWSALHRCLLCLCFRGRPVPDG